MLARRFRLIPEVRLCLFGRQVECISVVFEMSLVRAVANGFVLGHAAAADAHELAPAQAIGVSVPVYDLEISFNSQRTIAIDGDLGGGHLLAIFGWRKYRYSSNLWVN